MTTKILFCFDGTCNEPDDADDFVDDGSISNILKLHAFFGGGLADRYKDDPSVKDQHSYYYSGIGTRGNKLRQIINAMIAPPAGDMEDILENAFSDLERHKDDASAEIYIFGFSRGAAIARMFASQVAKDGRKVTFLGVFDTVAATKKSLDLNPHTYPASSVVFENGSIHENIKEAVHLVSIDEKRITFQPTLFNHDKRVHEVWFAGAHSDVGGGYWFDGLSDISLDYMIGRIKGKVKVLSADKVDYSRLGVSGAESQICKDDLNINPLNHGKIHEQIRPSKIARKTLALRKVRVNENDMPTHDEGKLPIVHHTVAERFSNVPGYRPFALRDTHFQIEFKDKTIGKPVRGISELKDAPSSQKVVLARRKRS